MESAEPLYRGWTVPRKWTTKISPGRFPSRADSARQRAVKDFGRALLAPFSCHVMAVAFLFAEASANVSPGLRDGGRGVRGRDRQRALPPVSTALLVRQDPGPYWGALGFTGHQGWPGPAIYRAALAGCARQVSHAAGEASALLFCPASQVKIFLLCLGLFSHLPIPTRFSSRR